MPEQLFKEKQATHTHTHRQGITPQTTTVRPPPPSFIRSCKKRKRSHTQTHDRGAPVNGLGVNEE